jgi:hypothetical protein
MHRVVCYHMIKKSTICYLCYRRNHVTSWLLAIGINHCESLTKITKDLSRNKYTSLHISMMNYSYVIYNVMCTWLRMTYVSAFLMIGARTTRHFNKDYVCMYVCMYLCTCLNGHGVLSIIIKLKLSENLHRYLLFKILDIA